ncbi:ArnT family glycosyltransferase [Candidatus Leptofilum sp.]|uniref:ArnT family glycosyltransferase n=1 Tax=Candidatus Leptofilum sp. TaxID=3241576 RepID=UPI003B5A218A
MNLFLQRQRPFFSRQTMVLALLIFLAALLPRLLALGSYITPDELNWVHRSVLFHQALGQSEWEATLTTGHPGVLTTWLGALGLQVQLWLRPSDLAAYEWITHLAWLSPENTAAFPKLATFLSAGRMAMAAANSLGLVAVFWLTQRLVGDWAALATIGLLALDPFVAGLSGLLHVDGLMTTFSTISLLALAQLFTNVKKFDWRMTAVSGATAGCAILAKSTGLTLLPFVGLSFSVGLLVWWSQWRKLVLLGLVWLLAMVLAQFVLLPALWSDPVGSYQTIIGTILHETEEVLPPTFFMGSVHQAHGPAFYPMALLFRLNPLVLLGLLLGGWFGWQYRANKWWQRPHTILAISWPIFFILMLSLATKKYDRYLLPALPMLFLLGAVGWNQLLQKRPSWAKPFMIGGALVALVYVGTAVPYLLNAYNPLVGGQFMAKYVMPLGWGEGVSAAAQWLAEQPGAAEKTAVAGIGPAFAPYFPGKTILRDGDNWQSADYVVETLTGYQDAQFGPQHLRSGQTLLHTVRYDGQAQARVFRVDNPVEPEIDWQAQNSQFGGQIMLLAAGTAVQDDQLDVFLQWQLVQPTDGRFNVQVRLLDENDQLWSQMEMPLLNEVYFYPEHWQLDEQPVWRYPLALPLGLPPAQYRVEMTLFSDESGAQLPVVEADGRFAGVVQTVAELNLAPLPLFQTEMLALEAEPQPLLARNLFFLGQRNLPESVLTAGQFSVDLFWQGMADLPANLQLQFWANDLPITMLPLSRFETGSWQAGQVIHEKYRVAFPAEFAAGAYDLRVEIVAENGRSLSAPINLGPINVVSPDRLFSLPDEIGQPILLRFGDLVNLHGYDLQTGTAVPGDHVQLTLYWRADRQPDEIFSTFVHLVGPDGQIVVQGDQWPGGLPSNTWAAGQVIIDEYAIQLPEDAPLGRYQIVLGLYPPANGLRLPIAAEDGTTLPGDQFVLPLEVVGR